MPIHIPAGIHASRTKILSSYEQLILVVHIRGAAKNGQTNALALSLFMLRIFTDYSDTAFSLDDFAFFANWFN